VDGVNIVGKPETIEKVSVTQEAAKLTEPFTMIDLARVDDLALSVFLCQGTLPYHRHLDQDELFLVQNGTITLESEWGSVILRPGELAVVPKGLAHRSSSLLQSLVLLMQPRLMVNRRNGDRRLFTLKDERSLEKVNVPAHGRHISIPFRPVLLADLDTFAVHLTLCKGTSPWWCAERQSNLILCHTGQISLESEVGSAQLGSSELAIVPQATRYRLSSADGALVMGVQRHKQPGPAAPN
jgi:homogentisate 1,2-dioxygenase